MGCPRHFSYLCVLTIITLSEILIGCSLIWPHTSEFSAPTMFQENPCGFLNIAGPLVNVSGHVTAPVQPGTMMELFVVRNTSLDTALFTVENCPALIAVPVDTDGAFTFSSLPIGDYVVMLPGDSFGNKTQGFPIIPEFNNSGLEVGTLWHGGNVEYSMAAFSIHPIH